MGIMGFGQGYLKPGKGVSKKDTEKHRFIIFFEVVGRKFWKLVQLSLIFTFISIPALCVYFMLSSVVVPSALGMFLGQQAVEGMADYLMFYTLVFAAFMLLMLGSGPASCGAYYVLRNFSREEHSWVFSDFFEQFGKNFKQGIAVFGINTAVAAVLVVNLVFYSGGMADSIPEPVRLMLITVLCIFTVIFCIMQMYIYPMMVTFDLKVKHLLRNSLLFAIYKLPQNLLIFIFTVLSFGVVAYFGEQLPLVYLLFPCVGYALLMLVQTFYTFNVMASSMIQEQPKDEDGEHTFEDTL